jgi:outer membrane protein OmpA-like peptidoglycan-associated protein
MSRHPRLLIPALGLTTLLACGFPNLSARTDRERDEARRLVAEALEERTRPERRAELFRQARDLDPAYAACEEGARLEDQGRFPEAAESFRACREEDPGLIAAHRAWAEALVRARGRPVYAEVLTHLRQVVTDQRQAAPRNLQPIEELIADLEDLVADDFSIEEPREWTEEEILEILTRKDIRGSSRYDGPRTPLWLDFRPGDDHLGKPAEEQLRAVARALKDGLLADAVIRIEGYADSLEGSSEAARRTVATRRAQAVREFLVRNGVPPRRLQVVGVGERHPIASNRTKEGREANRRVELYNLETKQPLLRDVRKP